jgi:hypothetical protein
LVINLSGGSEEKIESGISMFSIKDRNLIRDHVLQLAASDARIVAGAVVGSLALSFTPASKFGATGPKFKLLFGSSVESPYAQPPPAQELFGYAVHHALRARFCIERGRYWHAEYWISAARDYALSLACRRRGLPVYHGRGFDDLPTEVRDVFIHSLITSLERDELLRALGVVINGLFGEADEVRELAIKVEAQLRELAIVSDS